MKIGIDLDEVLADFLTALIKFHNDKYDTAFERHQFHSYRVFEIWGGTQEESDREIFEFYNTNYFKEIKPVPNAIENIDFLCKDHELAIITSRQNDIAEKTLDWINKHFENKFKGVYFTNQHSHSGKSIKKSAVCGSIGANLIIEDYLDYATECAQAGKEVLLFDCPWNKTRALPEKVSRVYSWNEITDTIKNNYRKDF